MRYRFWAAFPLRTRLFGVNVNRAKWTKLFTFA